MFTTGKRQDLHNLLKQVPGLAAVYFQPPANVQMQYPCVVYDIDAARTEFAGNMPYVYTKRYQITVIHREPDSDIPDTIAMLPTAVFNQHFTANNLHHSVFTLYF